MRGAHFLLILIISILVSGCHHVSVRKEYHALVNKVQQTTTLKPLWVRQKSDHQELSREYIEQLLHTGLTRHQAVIIALQRDPRLQAAFEDLGVAKADLVQAGLFTNPSLQTVFDWPKNSSGTIFSANVSVELADLWKVPVKRSIAQELLHIKTNEVTQLILSIIAETKTAYDTVVYAEENLHITEKITQRIKELRNLLYSPDPGREISDYDKNYTDVAVARWELDTIQQRVSLENAHTNFRKLLNVVINKNPLKPLNALDYHEQFEPVDKLVERAYRYQPALKIAQFSIKRAEQEKALAKARFLNGIEPGFDYNHSPNSTIRGLSLTMEVPLFDPRRTEVERAQFVIEKAKKEYESTKIQLNNDIHQIHQQLLGYDTAIPIFMDQIIPASRKALDVAQKGFKTLDINIVSLVSSIIDLYTSERDLLVVLYSKTKRIYELEKTIGYELATEQMATTHQLSTYKKIFERD